MGDDDKPRPPRFIDGLDLAWGERHCEVDSAHLRAERGIEVGDRYCHGEFLGCSSPDV
jgi:hypothetical protein